jgi:hypothetical protein
MKRIDIDPLDVLMMQFEISIANPNAMASTITLRISPAFVSSSIINFGNTKGTTLDSAANTPLKTIQINNIGSNWRIPFIVYTMLLKLFNIQKKLLLQ